MGVFRDIVRNSRKTEKAFKLGFTFGGENEDIECMAEFVEKEGGIEPSVRSVTLKFTDGKIVLSADDKSEVPIHLAACDKKQNYYRVDVYSMFLSQDPFRVLFDHLISSEERQSKGDKALANYLQGKREGLEQIHGGMRSYPWRKIRRTAYLLYLVPRTDSLTPEANV